MLRYFCFLAVFFSVRSASAPFIKPCKASDSVCLVASAQAAVPIIAPGIPELGISSLDPMNLDIIKSDEGGLKLEFKNTVVKGMKGCKVDGIKLDTNKMKMSVVIRCDVILRGDYKFGGQLLILPIQGQGKYSIKIRDIVIKAFTDLTTVTGADGQTHWHINKWRHTYNVKTGTEFQFENLFNGNKVLADSVLAFANNNWREVMQEIAPPIVHAIVSRVVDGVEALYKSVPLDQLLQN